MLIKSAGLATVNFLILVVGMGFPILACGEWRSTQFDSMGTRFELEIWAPSEQKATQLNRKVREELEFLENLLSPYISSSDVSRINSDAGQGSVEVNEITFQIVQQADRYSRMSDGAFDISFASVGRKYDYPKGIEPADAEREALSKLINYRMINSEKQINEGVARNMIGLEKKGMAIDLGGIAKGFAVDRVAEILINQGVESAAISLGGDSRFIGDRGYKVHPSKSTQADSRIPWIVAIKHPRGGEKDRPHALRIPLVDAAFSTSGDYERFFIDEDGERVHHIVDVETGKSSSKVVSVSIIGSQSSDCDALATTVFVLGVEKGIELIEKLEGYDAIIIDAAGKMHYSSGLE